MRPHRSELVLPLATIACALAAWWIGVAASRGTLVPSPLAVGRALGELATKGLLFRYVVASLFRVTWGYLAAVILGIPLGIALGLSRRAEWTVNPFVQFLRPVSPLAWIPIAILWFGVGDLSAIFLIFLASLLPLTVAAMNAVHNLEPTHLRAGINFGLRGWPLLRRVIIPAILPQLLLGMRVTLGVAWLVVVAAEMIAVNSGLGFLIVDARNAGNRYDLVVAGMVLIGLTGLVLDSILSRLATGEAA